jgi:hypothetical protein
MGFIDKVKRVVSGKREIEVLQESSANKIIRAKANASALQERQKQAIRIATEREKIYADNKIKQMRQPKQSFFSAQPTLGMPFGSPIRDNAMPSRPKTTFQYIKKGKRYIRRRVKMPRPSQPAQPQRYDVLGSLGGFGSGRRII